MVPGRPGAHRAQRPCRWRPRSTAARSSSRRPSTDWRSGEGRTSCSSTTTVDGSGRSRTCRARRSDVEVPGADGTISSVRIRVAVGTGLLLDQGEPFHDARGPAATPDEVSAWLDGTTATRPGQPDHRRAAAGARRPCRARQRRAQPAHVHVRAVGLGEDLLARAPARARARRDHAAHRHPRPQLRLRRARSAPRRSRPDAGRGAIGRCPTTSPCGATSPAPTGCCGCASPSSIRAPRAPSWGSTRSPTGTSTPC